MFMYIALGSTPIWKRIKTLPQLHIEKDQKDVFLWNGYEFVRLLPIRTSHGLF